MITKIGSCWSQRRLKLNCCQQRPGDAAQVVEQLNSTEYREKLSLTQFLFTERVALFSPILKQTNHELLQILARRKGRRSYKPACQGLVVKYGRRHNVFCIHGFLVPKKFFNTDWSGLKCDIETFFRSPCLTKFAIFGIWSNSFFPLVLTRPRTNSMNSCKLVIWFNYQCSYPSCICKFFLLCYSKFLYP